MTSAWTRRRFIATAAAAAAGTGISRSPALSEDGWRAGPLQHLIPAANHDRVALKCSFAESLDFVPVLRIGGRLVAGRSTDTERRFYSFDAPGLEPDTEYPLQLLGGGEALCDPWPLRTFPLPSTQPESVRFLAYTCAGGHAESGFFLPLAVRRRLLRRALSFRPRALIAIGDHVYWDQRTVLYNRGEERGRRSREFYERIGWLDLSLPALGTRNETSLKAAVGPQIADLYGVMLRSTPSYFVSDDHDYYENDDADPQMVTLPPDRYQVEFARFTRNAYLPEFLPDVERPLAMSGTGAGDREPGISEAFGTFRYGQLAEVLIYDCARYLSLKGVHAGLVPPETEHWLHQRTQDQSVSQVFHVPSHPFGWSAGKWREWYPDVADLDDGGATVSRIGDFAGSNFRLTTEREKYFWQEGWWRQHQRLLESLTSQPQRAGIVLSGDLHAIGHSVLERSGSMDLSTNPVHAVLTGPLGTLTGWPSAARGTPPLAATAVEQDVRGETFEKNGFALFDVTPSEVTVRLFAWKTGEPESAIDELEPYHTAVIRRG
ncbi:MAG: hypothetical protein OYL92_06380 [Acidobacteriota bacterium]|nr:hypothetical protein [Acidobacteriota bacterium]MDE2921426.1 hypothetical protein [Acidobacteriota bacterium]MDE3264581.1 hypothetical protein [Acidobacteriota bacterium]